MPGCQRATRICEVRCFCKSSRDSGAAMSAGKYLYLTTIGHKTGRPHEIEIWYVEHRGCYYLVSEKREASHWVRNIRANPSISFRLDSRVSRGRASLPDDAQLLAAVKAKMVKKYGWSNGLVIELKPDVR
ncbi:MAG: nitroreductase/quinone reductase family protein [Chloroflexi bacterium]|nr:nitroreductase/quinone reductase family protein [Chloroflexota bacterium]